MRMRAFLFWAVLMLPLMPPARANSSQTLVLSGTVPPRVDEVAKLQEGVLKVDPSQEPSIKVYVQPLLSQTRFARAPASVVLTERRVTAREDFNEPARLIFEAP
ncbi:MAG: hypothetical protein KF681_04165 [Bdellovibrionaceae bacterium]|nr:hypothetical protein [Pseudobdellovibrionaceae bacterium]